LKSLVTFIITSRANLCYSLSFPYSCNNKTILHKEAYQCTGTQ